MSTVDLLKKHEIKISVFKQEFLHNFWIKLYDLHIENTLHIENIIILFSGGEVE